MAAFLVLLACLMSSLPDRSPAASARRAPTAAAPSRHAHDAEPVHIASPRDERKPLESGRRGLAPPANDESGAAAPPTRAEAHLKPSAPSDGRVRVHGTLLAAGRPRPFRDLAFRALDPRYEDPVLDWEFTDAHGDFEAVLPPGLYLVSDEADGASFAELAVERALTDQRVVLELPSTSEPPE